MKTDKINLPTDGKCYCYPPQNAHTNLRAENNADICLFLQIVVKLVFTVSIDCLPLFLNISKKCHIVTFCQHRNNDISVNCLLLLFIRKPLLILWSRKTKQIVTSNMFPTHYCQRKSQTLRFDINYFSSTFLGFEISLYFSLTL